MDDIQTAVTDVPSVEHLRDHRGVTYVGPSWGAPRMIPSPERHPSGLLVGLDAEKGTATVVWRGLNPVDVQIIRADWLQGD